MGAFVSSPNKAHRASTSHGGPKASRKKSSVDKPAKDAPSQPLLPPVHDKASPAATAGRGDIAKLPPPQKDYRSNGHTAPHSADSHVTAPTTTTATTTTTAGHSDVQRHESTFSYGYSSYLEHLAQEERRTSEAVTTDHTFDNFHFPPLPSGQKSSSGDYNYASGTLVNTPAAVAAAASGLTQNAGQASTVVTQGNAAGPPSALIETGHTGDDGRPSMQSAAPLTNFDTYTSVFRETLLTRVNAEADSIDLRSNNGSGGSSHDGARCEYSFFPESAQQRRSTALTASVVPLQATDTSVPRPRKSTRFSHAGLKSSRHSTTTSRRETTSHTLMSSLFGRRSRVDRWSDTFMQSITNVTQSRPNSADQDNAAAAESSMKTDSLSGSAAELHRTMHLGERQWQRVRQSVVQLHEGLREYFNTDDHQDHVQCAESNTFSNTDSIVGPPATVLPQNRTTNAGQDQPRQSYAWDGGISAVYETMSRSGSSDGSARRKSSVSSSDGSSDGTEDGRGGRDFVRGSSLMPSTAKQHRRMLDGMGSISNWESGPGATALRSSRVMERGSYRRASAEDGETNTTTSDDDTEEEESESSASEVDNGMQREGEATWGRGRRRSTRAQRVVPSGMTGPCLRQNGRPQAPVVPPPMMMMPGPAPYRRFAPPPLVQVSQPYGGAAMPFAHTPQPQPQQKPKPSTTTQPPANYGNVHPPQHAASVPPRVTNRVPQPQPDLRGPPLRRKVPINYERAFNFSLRDIPWVKSPSWEDMKVYSRQQRNKARA